VLAVVVEDVVVVVVEDVVVEDSPVGGQGKLHTFEPLKEAMFFCQAHQEVCAANPASTYQEAFKMPKFLDHHMASWQILRLDFTGGGSTSV
jgi:hypothetical protein